MKKRIEDVQEAINLAYQQPFCMMGLLSSVYLGKTREIEDMSSLRWARFFGEESEIRFVCTDNGLKAFLIEDNDSQYFDRTYEIENSSVFGNTLTVRYLMDFDSDGQAFISTSRLLSAEV